MDPYPGASEEVGLEAEVPRKAALNYLISGGIETVLRPAGFKKSAGTPLTWSRQTSELTHIVALDAAKGAYRSRWGIFDRDIALIVHGKVPKRLSVAYSFVEGGPQQIRHPAAAGRFRIGESVTRPDLDDLVGRLAQDIKLEAEYLAPMQSRLDVRSLLDASNAQESDGGYFFPTSETLKALVVAALALLDDDEAGPDLVDTALTALLASGGDVNIDRGRRLRALQDARKG